jgi:hypothetical protein
VLKSFLAALAFVLFLAAPQPASAVCSSPAGTAGQTLYNADFKEMQYCDNTNWISMGQGPETGPGCSGPAGSAGQILYNKDYRVLQYCNSNEWVGMGAAGYIAWGMNFNGASYVRRGANMTGGADLGTFTASFWFRRALSPQGALQYIYANSTPRFSIQLTATDKLRVLGKNTGNTTTLDITGSTTITDTNWHHVLIATDLSSASNRYIYLDGVAETLTVTTYTVGGIIDYTETEHAVGALDSQGTTRFTGDLADFYFVQNYQDASSAPVREKFRNTDGTPADLGSTCQNPTGSTPLVCLSDKASGTWITNKGTGGGFTLVGSLTSSTGNLPGLACAHNTIPQYRTTIGGGTRGLWSDGTYVYLANGGIYVYSFNGTTLTALANNTTNTTNAWGAWGDGAYIYVADDTGGIDAYTFDGATLTFKGTTGAAAGPFRDVWGDGTYIYAARHDSGIQAYTFNGTTFTFKASIVGSTGSQPGYNGVWGDGTYIYGSWAEVSSGNGGIHAFTFNGTSFTYKGSDIFNTVGGQAVWGDGAYIYVADSADGISAYTFNGTTFTEHASTTLPVTGARDVWGNGTDIYVSDFDGSLNVYTFNGTTFTLKSTDAINTTSARGVWGNGNYVFVVDGGLDAYVYPTELCSCSSPAGTEGQTLYNNDFNTLQYCNGSRWVGIGK